MQPLRPFQKAALDFALARKDKRAIFAHAPSAGKSRVAIEFGLLIGAQRILIVAPAMARANFVREVAKWAPSYSSSLEAVRYGRTRKNLTKAQTAQREASYAANVQVVSFDLLKEIDARPRDLVIIDEVHSLRSPTSKQSKIAKAYLRANPTTAALGLSGTPVPTEIVNIWNPVDTFWPGLLGRAGKNGGVPWRFKMEYCGAEENEYAAGGFSFKGQKSPETTVLLAQKLSAYMHTVSDSEVAAYLPKLDASPLYLDAKCVVEDVASEWLETVEAQHVALVVFSHESALALMEKFADRDPILLSAMAGDASRRDAKVEEARRSANSFIIATSESVRESISLAFVQRALIQEWRTTPAQALQLMGRFRRSDADPTRPPKIEYVVQPGDEARAELLNERLGAVRNLLGKSQAGTQLEELFAPRPLTEERLNEMCDNMFKTARLNREDWEDDNEF